MAHDIQFWQSRLTEETKERERYRNQCRKIEKIYADEKSIYNERLEGYTTSSDFNDYEFNILWSNIQTLLAALYSQDPKPDVRRRHKDDNPVAREVAIVTERVLEYIEDTTDFHPEMRKAVENFLVGHPGVVRVKYKPYLGPGEEKAIPVYNVDGEYRTSEEEEYDVFEMEDVILGENGEMVVMQEQEELLFEEAYVECIPGPHFHWELVDSWKKVRWAVIEHYLDEDQLKVQFPKKWEDIPTGYTDTAEDRDSKIRGDQDADDNPKARIFECFDKEEGKVYVFAEGMDEFLEELDDPYNLEGFFPFSRPLLPTVARSDGTPTPDYIYYQDQHAQLNTLVQRISTLTAALKYRGLYDATLKEAPDISALEDGEFDPVVALSDRMMADGMMPNLQNFFYTMPLAEGASLLNQLHTEVELVKQQIYEITGISDIVRGATKASETLGAQQMKAQFANLRLANKQVQVETFCRDVFRIIAETISEEFDQDTLEQMSGMEVSDEMMMMFTDDLLRSYNINVETDSTVLKDAAEEQRVRIEALQALTQLFTELFPMVQAGMPVDLVGQLIMFGLRGLKGGRELEAIVQTIIDNATQQTQEGQGPSPEEQMMMMQEELQGQFEQKMAQLDEGEKAALTRKHLADAEAQEIENDLVSSKVMEFLGRGA